MFFKDIHGNDAIKRQLIGVVDGNRLSHAILFSGTEGNAKLQLALALATYLNCDNRHDGDSCGVCPSCRQMHKLAHPDLHFVYPIANSTKKNIKAPSSDDFIEDWREFVFNTHGYGTINDWYNCLGASTGQGIINANDCNNIIRTLSYTSCESKYKIVVIWMIEKLFYSAAPKILKILEEPPEETLFILITENKNAILDTILSRTQTLNIPPFTNGDIRQILIDDYSIDEDEAVKISDISDGNVAIAIDMALSPENIEHFFDEFIQWMRICLKANMLSILSFVNEFSNKTREQILFFLKGALSQLHQAMFYNATGKFLIPVAENHLKVFTNFSKFVTVSNINIFYEAINKTIRNVERNGYIPLLMTNLTINLCRVFNIALNNK